MGKKPEKEVQREHDEEDLWQVKDNQQIVYGKAKQFFDKMDSLRQQQESARAAQTQRHNQSSSEDLMTADQSLQDVK